MTVAGLLDPNPAAHGVWIVAEAVFALLVVFLLVDLYDRLADRLRARSERAAGAPSGSRPARRRATPFGVLRRFWTEGRPNEPVPPGRGAQRRGG